MEELTIRPIGIVHCDIEAMDQTPKNYDESDQTGTIALSAELLDGLDGIEPGQTIVVLFWLHQADRSVLRVHPRGDKSRKKRGVFATRSPSRPNPVALSELKVTAIAGNRISVSGLDVIDGTPVIDIKKTLSPRS